MQQRASGSATHTLVHIPLISYDGDHTVCDSSAAAVPSCLLPVPHLQPPGFSPKAHAALSSSSGMLTLRLGSFTILGSSM